jgi:hypothetical protein
MEIGAVVKNLISPCASPEAMQKGLQPVYFCVTRHISPSTGGPPVCPCELLHLRTHSQCLLEVTISTPDVCHAWKLGRWWLIPPPPPIHYIPRNINPYCSSGVVATVWAHVRRSTRGSIQQYIRYRVCTLFTPSTHTTSVRIYRAPKCPCGCRITRPRHGTHSSFSHSPEQDVLRIYMWTRKSAPLASGSEEDGSATSGGVRGKDTWNLRSTLSVQPSQT